LILLRENTSTFSRSKKNIEGHQDNQSIGASRGGKTTKIHTVADALGNPVAFKLTGGQVFDSVPAIELLSQLDLNGSNIIGDKAYGSSEIRQWINEQGADYLIPPRENATPPWDVAWYLYKERHLVECFFSKLKHFKRIATPMTN